MPEWRAWVGSVWRGWPRLLSSDWNESLHPRDKDGKFAESAVTRVGITSQRPVGDVEHQTNREVFRRMETFKGTLVALPGVRNVSVKPGLGAWKTDDEATWRVAYRGNGEARKLLAATGAKYKQDSVLVMHRCTGDRRTCDPAVELHFEQPLNRAAMKQLNDRLGQAGFGGWTWGKVAGRTMLRVVSVPAWGGEREKHLVTMKRVSDEFAASGLAHARRTKFVRTEVFDESNYAAVAAGEA